jgi:pSer/pThr/pTyr-binding forkhead associated (FHA) protein
MSAKLVVSAGPEEGKVFQLADDTTVIIGRADNAQVRLTDQYISRGHCTIELRGGVAVIADSGSRTGTRVNGKPITRHELRTDEVINVGQTKLVFQFVKTLQPGGEAQAESNDHPELRKLSNTKLAHFDLGAVVGVGNSGLVFRAKDFKEDREVALKVYTPEFA